MSIAENVIQLPTRTELPGPPDLLTLMVGSALFVFDRVTGKEQKRAAVLAFPSGEIIKGDSPATIDGPQHIFRLNESGRITVEPKGAEQLRGDLCFVTEASLSRLTEKEPLSRLVAIWNELPDVKPVQRFSNRKTAVHRIWRVVETLKPGWERTRKRTPKPMPKPDVDGPTLIKVLTMLKTEEGATIPELVIGSGCHPERIRAVLTEVVEKELMVKIQSFERIDGTHAQRIK